MRKPILIFLSFCLGTFFSITPFNETLAKNKKNSSVGTGALTVINNEGESVLNGSVLNPDEDELFIQLHSVLASILRGDLANVSIVLSSIADPSKKLLVSKSAIRLRSKRINNKKREKYLSVNLFNLKTPTGITIPPSALQSDDYKLRIVGKKVDLSTKSFSYRTPALVVGMAEKKNSGFVVVEDLMGTQISDSIVGLNPSGFFFTEVRANMIKPSLKNNASLRSSLKSQVNDDFVPYGVVHVVSDEDLYAVAPLDNNTDTNGLQADDPLLVNEGSTLTASLAKNDEDLAIEIAKKQLEDLESGSNSTDYGELSCDINQFADRCGSDNAEQLASLGEDVKGLISNPQCNLPDFVISSVLTSEGNDVGSGYCSFINREEDSNRICSDYSEILKQFKAGNLKQLPCPPVACTEFQNIKPPRCVITQGYCEDGAVNSECISKPKRDLFCLQVPNEIPNSDCVDDETSDPDGIQPEWVVETGSLGNDFCVPSNPSILEEIKIFSQSVLSSQDVANECEYNYCYKQCDSQSEVDINDCHLNCDVVFGKIIDCTDTSSPYFSIQCCKNIKTISSKVSTGKAPVDPDVANCLCSDSNNFDEVGYAYEDSRLACKDICPAGYEKDGESEKCLPVCPVGFVRNPDGYCKKDCPPGFVIGDSGVCACPEGQKKDSLTGLCISTSLCGSNLIPNPNIDDSEQAACICPSGLLYFDGKSCVAQCPSGTVPDSSSDLLLNSPIPCVKSQTSCKSPFISNTSGTPSCKCPDSLPYYYIDTCVSTCPSTLSPQKTSTGIVSCLCSDGSSPDSTGKCSVKSHTCSIGEVSTSTNSCTCASPATKGTDGTCQCPSGQTYTANGCTSGSSTTTTCAAGQISTSTNPCTCTSGGTIGTSGYCQCTNGQTYTAANGCSSSTAVPSNPTALTGSYLQSGVLLTWTDNSSNETEFSIYRRLAGATAWTLISGNLGANTTSYTDTSAVSGSSYEYRVIACNITGCSSDSNIVTVNVTSNSSTTTTCSPGQVSTSANPCTCASGATVGSAGYCQCTNGQTYAAAGCPTPTCTNSQVSTSTNPCNCASPATVGSAGYCQCPDGSIYSSNGCFMAHNCEPGEASTSLNPCTCTGSATLGSNSTCQCPSGQSYTVLSGCTGTANQITLNSVIINGSTVTVSYSKNFSSCVTLQTIHHVPVHTSSSLFCGDSSATPSITLFDTNFQSNLQVKLCNSDLTVCSSIVTTTGTPNCRSGQISTSDNPCNCASGAYSGGSTGCYCSNGNSYDQVNGCYQICTPGQNVYGSYPYCTCPTNSTQNSNNICVCSDGSNAPTTGCP